MIESALMRAWHRRGGVAVALLPLAALFGVISALRRGLFQNGLLRAVRLPVPVVIVGNITVGGVGKTPLSIHLVEELLREGRHPGVVSRGYGRHSEGLVEVLAGSTPAQVGDEPLLIARRTGVPVMVASDRVAAAQALLARHPEVDVILSDDGLQHYRLDRTFEIVVLDGRGVMNGWLLPAGPLRESISRLRRVDAVVINGGAAEGAVLPAPTSGVSRFSMHLEAGELYRLSDPTTTICATQLTPGPVHALAGIGHPQRFFAQLATMGLQIVAHPFPDHHDYVLNDLPDDGRPILTTEKDAVKLAALVAPVTGDALSGRDIWVLPVHARLQPVTSTVTLTSRILEKIDGPSPA